nr:hypothetical protein [Tanacetum cinerariifolium]
MAIPKDLIIDVIYNSEYYQKYLDIAARKPRLETTVTDKYGGKKIAPLAVVESKGKGILTDEQAAQSLLDLQKPKKQSTTDQYIFQRRTSVTQDASTGL